ncbi:MAG: cyanoexosortase B [Scytolyngbya sp. HA4215-MV1]|jgi:cyanoexosortase B|nr:cyanoexosortase B [Scytolyngbya sp. HA4215-MV1]
MQTGRKVPLLSDRDWIEVVIVALLGVLYAPLLLHWYNGWLHKTISIEHEYFSHGLIGLPFAAYIIWLNRKRWHRLADTCHPLGLALLPLVSIFYLSGLPDFVNLSLPLVLLGLCLCLKGLPGLRLQAFPLLMIFLATPNELPYLLTPYTLPLQSFIAGTAGFILSQFGMDITVEHIYLFVGGRIVEVAPYCAGLKMLFTSLYVALMLLYWRDDLSSRLITGLFLGCSAILSVTANIFRNTFLTLFHGTGQEQLFSWLHEGWGGDLYSTIMLGLLIPVLIGLENYFSPFSDEPPSS